MINIHKKLWVAKGVGRVVADSTQLLAYMCQREYTKEGEETKAFSKRKETGVHWAKRREYDYEVEKYKPYVMPEELLFDNTPINGFKVVGSVSRWSTSNKLIQIEDPRGFVVEIPTGNLTTLLKHTTITECEVMGECLWGREGSDHILIPVNSKVYDKSLEQRQQHNNRISFAKLTVGQVVKFSVDDDVEFVYLGRGKAVWEITTRQAVKGGVYNWHHSSLYHTGSSDAVIESECIEDTKWCFVFVSTDSGIVEYKASGKCTVTRSVKELPTFKIKYVFLPSRLEKVNDMERYWIIDPLGLYKSIECVFIHMKDSKEVSNE